MNGPAETSILLFTHLFPVVLARQRLFHPEPFTGFEVKGMALDFLDNVLLLDFPLEAA